MKKEDIIRIKERMLRTDISMIQLYVSDLQDSIEACNKQDIVNNIKELQDYLDIMRSIIED